MNAALACAQANRGLIARVFGRRPDGTIGDYIEGRIDTDGDLIRITPGTGDHWIVPPGAVAGIIVADPPSRAEHVARSFR